MNEEWPSYYPRRPEHLKALGVIALSYSSFQRSLQDLYAFHPGRQKLPHKLTDLYYTSLSEKAQLKAIRTVFAEFEKDPKIVALVDNLLKFFDWCSHARNELLHSEHYPSIFGGDKDKLYLIKQASKKDKTSTYKWPTSQELRDIADKIEEGKRSCAGVIVHLRYRDVPPDKRPLSARMLIDTLPPEPLEIPPKLHSSPHPQHGKPPYLTSKRR